MRVLLIKTSSMGDVIHALPALTDAQKAIPNIEFDWVVEEGFADIPAWHPAVKNVIPVALRRWRKNIFKAQTQKEWRAFKRALQTKKYDLVIDAQGLLKSAFLTFFANGPRAGLDSASAREGSASWFYQQKFFVNKKQNAIQRLRELFSKALHYELPTNEPDFSLQINALQAPQPYVVFLHGTTWSSKAYPVASWCQLARLLIDRGFHIKLSGKSDEEMTRAQTITEGHAEIDFTPAMSIVEMAQMLAGAHAVVTVDTGFGHLAAAMGAKTIAIFGATNADLTGVVGEKAINLSADFPCSPCMRRTCTYKKPSQVVPACYGTVPPELIATNI